LIFQCGDSFGHCWQWFSEFFKCFSSFFKCCVHNCLFLFCFRQFFRSFSQLFCIVIICFFTINNDSKIVKNLCWSTSKSTNDVIKCVWCIFSHLLSVQSRNFHQICQIFCICCNSQLHWRVGCKH
jgi:hypothetical protein